MLPNDAVEVMLLQEIVENKGTRERVIKQSIERYYDLCLKVIAIYELERVNDKYFRQIREYTENSYNKRKIKEEEIIFLRKIFVSYKIYNAITETLEYKDAADLLTNKIYDDSKYISLDNELYQEVFNEAFDIRN
ncbi:hypothetical protein RZE82_00475 [Mollicutes bacterium LVI A0039]|nr:hypothetical protein RZE82_00475 [Mollicutes bacterium LVI A0039]